MYNGPERVDRLRERWQEYEAAFFGAKSVPFDASRESLIAAYTDWVDAYENVYHPKRAT